MPDYPVELNAAQAKLLPGSSAESLSSGAEEFVQLFDEIRVPLLRYLAAFPLSAFDAEDVAQEAFLSLYGSLQKGNRHPNARGWLFKAAHHLALKKRQQSRRDAESAESTAHIEAVAIDPGRNPEDDLAFRQMQQRMQSVVRALPEQVRWCLYLRAEGLRYREIAETLDIALGSVALYLERSLKLVGRAVQR